ncbi:hypothetical protein PHMEG_00014450 [Phytophthora megakarya]|uniref:WLGC domain-containing protein n=1 Tax=Phytophthora megakarya TaxID=4795 RepID=A0A225W6B9_9STRA|nr:hypothetical protein PHMEG_00014450 [Phytophthora megakarya]
MPTSMGNSAIKSQPEDGESRDEGPLRRKSSLMRSNSKNSPTKIYPGTEESYREGTLEKKSSKYLKSQMQAKTTLKTRQDGAFAVLPWVISLAVIICLGWTILLILLNIAPNDTVNRVMNTTNFDYGSFWLMVNPPKAMMIAATLGLILVAGGYIGVFLKIIHCQQNNKEAYMVHQLPDGTNFMKKLEKTLDDATTNPRKGKITSIIVKLIAALAREDSKERKISVRYTREKLLMKFGDLALETFLLYQMLESGSPAVLIVIFTVVVASNSLICAVMMFIPYEQAPRAEIFIDIMFDFLIAIACPMLTVVYCLSTFTFDREKLAINLAVFPAGWFEQSASVIADPVQTAIIYKSLKSLRIMSALDFFSRLGVNGTLCFRLRSVVDTINNPKKQQSSVYPKRNRLGAIALILFTASLLIFVEESMGTSALACKPHPECVVFARRWILIEDDSLTQCPCLTMIDRDIAPQTFAEWETPTNVTEKVAQLATTGDLQTLQLTNRYIAELPGELRSCTGFRHMSLEYTHTQTLPSWIKELTSLEYLHLESKFTSPMTVLPDDVFDDMSSLTFIHFAAFMSMTKLPSFQGLTNIRSMTLACFLNLVELPAFDTLQNLERLVLASMPAMESLPDLSPVSDMKSFAVSDRGAWCCNGFIGDCNLNDRKCGVVHPVWGNPPATCLAANRTEKVATAATRTVVEKFAGTICGPVLEVGVLEGPPTQEIMAPCNGTLYRQCLRGDNIESMCYNARFMAIACTTNPYPIEMRRRQIAQGVGDTCDPEIEAWLGCK